MREHLYLLTAVLGLAVFSACSIDGHDSEMPVSFNVTLSDSYDTQGMEISNIWQSSGRCAFFCQEGDGSMYTATVLTPGASSGDFRLNLSSEQAAGAIAVAYPVDGGFSMDGICLEYEIPSLQMGELRTMMTGIAAAGASPQSRTAELKNGYCAVFLYVDKELGAVKSAEFRSKSGVGIAGKVSFNIAQRKFSASESSVRVEYRTPLECGESTCIPIMVAPVTLSGGYEAVVTTDSGEVVSIESDRTLILTAGGKHTLVLSGSAPVEAPTSLAVCGDNMVYFIHPDAATFDESVYWKIDLRDYAAQLGLKQDRCDHVDECKVVDGGTKLLLTSSYSFAALIDIETRELLWCTNRCPNAHSAVLLPNDRVAVATSSGDDEYHRKVIIYDLSVNHQEVYKTEVRSCHAVLWDEQNQKLHACGLHETDNALGAVYTFSLKDWDTSAPSLELDGRGETVFATKAIHDAVQVDGNTLMTGGNKAWFYSLSAGTFTEIPHFAGYTGIKSLNYNPGTGECWYTASDNDDPVPDKESSTRVICCTRDINGTTVHKKMTVPQDIYKVRVISW